MLKIDKNVKYFPLSCRDNTFLVKTLLESMFVDFISQIQISVKSIETDVKFMWILAQKLFLSVEIFRRSDVIVTVVWGAAERTLHGCGLDEWVCVADVVCLSWCLYTLLQCSASREAKDILRALVSPDIVMIRFLYTNVMFSFWKGCDDSNCD